jgi:hypothetical protein
MLEDIKNKIKRNKIKIIQVFLIFLWLYLIIFNYITISRLIVFFIILLYIWIYKKLAEKIKLMKPIENINI